MSVSVPMTMTMAVAVAVMSVMIMVIVMGWSRGWVVIVVFLVVVVMVFLNGVVVMPMAVSVSIFHFFQETYGIQKGDPESEKYELGKAESERGLVVQNVWYNVDSRQVHKSSRCDEDNRLSGHYISQQADGGSDHGRKGRPKLRHDSLLFAKATLDQNSKVSQLMGYFVKQNGKRRQTTPGFHNIPDTRGSRKTGKGSSNGQTIGELQRYIDCFSRAKIVSASIWNE